MKTMIRAGVTAASLSAFLPAWGSDASVEERLELRPPQLSLQQRADDALQAPRYALAPRESSECAEQGSAAGEPSSDRDEEKREQRDAAREQFLHEVWTAP